MKNDNSTSNRIESRIFQFHRCRKASRAHDGTPSSTRIQFHFQENGTQLHYTLHCGTCDGWVHPCIYCGSLIDVKYRTSHHAGGSSKKTIMADTCISCSLPILRNFKTSQPLMNQLIQCASSFSNQTLIQFFSDNGMMDSLVNQVIHFKTELEDMAQSNRTYMKRKKSRPSAKERKRRKQRIQALQKEQLVDNDSVQNSEKNSRLIADDNRDDGCDTMELDPRDDPHGNVTPNEQLDNEMETEEDSDGTGNDSHDKEDVLLEIRMASSSTPLQFRDIGSVWHLIYQLNELLFEIRENNVKMARDGETIDMKFSDWDLQTLGLALDTVSSTRFKSILSIAKCTQQMIASGKFLQQPVAWETHRTVLSPLNKSQRAMNWIQKRAFENQKVWEDQVSNIKDSLSIIAKEIEMLCDNEYGPNDDARATLAHLLTRLGRTLVSIFVK